MNKCCRLMTPRLSTDINGEKRRGKGREREREGEREPDRRGERENFGYVQ